MMAVRPELSEREMLALERGRQKRELVNWLRGEAASRDGDMAWYVARTRWSAHVVAQELRAAGIEAVCPLERTWKRYPRSTKRRAIDLPLFGNHAFVRMLKAESAWVGLMTFEGVAALLGNGERPVPVRDMEMRSVVSMLGEAIREKAGLSIGDEVLHPLGSFAELRGVVVEIDAEKRSALVSTVLFGRQIETRCGIDDLERLA